MCGQTVCPALKLPAATEHVLYGVTCSLFVWVLGWCKSVLTKWRRAGGRGGGEAGYRIKNKNPTQSCGEKHQPPATETVLFSP